MCSKFQTIASALVGYGPLWRGEEVNFEAVSISVTVTPAQ